MAFMEIAPNKEGSPHDHPFDQCRRIIEGKIERCIYFIPAGAKHNWKTMTLSARILDFVAKQGKKM
jgi:quercetin dioxygenase-like cupin family protein